MIPGLADKTRPMVYMLMHELGGAQYATGPLPPNPYEALATLAPVEVLYDRDPEHVHYPIWAAYVGAGAVVASAWLSVGKPQQKEEVIALTMGHVMEFFSEDAPVGKQDALELFNAGFDWLAQQELPGSPDTSEKE